MVLRRTARALQTLRERWWAFFHSRCLVGFPWYWPSRPPGKRAMVDARRVVRQHFGEDYHPTLRGLARIWVTTAWLPAVLIHLWQIRRDRGREAVPFERMPQAIWAAIRHNILPGEYFAYELWRPCHRANIDNYLYSNEAARLFKQLNRPTHPDPIGDKLALHEMCKAHALPTPPVLAVFAPAGITREFEPCSPPECDLFVKPQLGMSGRCAECLRWDGVGFVSNRGQRISPKDLDGYLATCARNQKRTLLAQPLLSNHPSLGIETNGGLASARLVTGLSMDCVVVPLFGFIYFARTNSITSQHGHVALIDVASGRLISAPPPDRSGAKHWNHRFDYGSSETVTLPDWNAALRFVEVAHRACANFVFVGWDIAFTDRGPMLLEGNTNWTADELQSLSATPLGITKFADILDERLRHRQSEFSLSETNALQISCKTL